MSARNTTTRKLSPLVQQYMLASLSENTRRAYLSDLDHFITWGGRIPSSPERIATYLAEHATNLSYSTLSRRVVSIGRAHTVKKFPSPTSAEIVKATLHGIHRTDERVKRRVSPALLPQLQEMVKELKGLRGLRDRTVLLVGFAGAFRRSELVAIRVEDIQFQKEGMTVHLRRGKTDQTSAGRNIAIPYMPGAYCPVKSLKSWLAKSKISSGPVFRSINRHGQVGAKGLSAQSVALIVKSGATSIGLDATKFSGHSLRVGLVTSAASKGVSSWKICLQTGHKSDAVMQQYIRNNNLFADNPLGKIW